jgi:hypothetical protein
VNENLCIRPISWVGKLNKDPQKSYEIERNILFQFFMFSCLLTPLGDLPPRIHFVHKERQVNLRG